MSDAVEYEPLPPWPWYNSEPRGEIVQRRADIKSHSWAMMFDGNFRVYQRKAGTLLGYARGGPIPRYHYRPVYITGETRVSWVCSHGNRYAKKGDALFGLLDVEDQLWIDVHKHRVTDFIRYSKIDANTLRQIAGLIGYRDEGVT